MVIIGIVSQSGSYINVNPVTQVCKGKRQGNIICIALYYELLISKALRYCTY